MRLFGLLTPESVRLRLGLVVLVAALGLTIMPAHSVAFGTTPTTSIVLPSNGATVSGTITLDAVATSGATQVQFWLTGAVGPFATATPTLYGWLAQFNTTTFWNGTYTFESVASFPGGVTETSPSVTITISNAAPTTSVLIPSNGAPVSGTQLLDASATPGVWQVWFLISGPGHLADPIVVHAALTIYGWLASWDSRTVMNGTYTLQSDTDYLSLMSGLSPPLIITVNNVAPATSMLIPAQNAVLSGTKYLDASAASGVSQVTFELSGGPDNYVDAPVATGTLTLYGWLASWNTTFAPGYPGGPVPNGISTLQSVASYFAGGISGTSAPITVTVSN